MNLDYKILWFENDKDWYDSIVDDVKEFIEDELAFKFANPILKYDATNFEQIGLADFDLILMDLNLLGGQQGDDIIKRIRDGEIYTDVIFYSSSGEKSVRDKVVEKELDGVYCVSREGDKFFPKLKKVIETTIKKVQDINNMRGLVMAQVAEIDQQMCAILDEFALNQPKESVIEFFEKRRQRTKDSISKTLKELDSASIIDLIRHREFNTSHKWMSIQSLLKIYKKECADLKEIVDNYKPEIIDKRNHLAHAVEDWDESGLKKILKTDDGFIFDDDVCKIIRNDLKIHSENFNKVLGFVESLNNT